MLNYSELINSCELLLNVLNEQVFIPAKLPPLLEVSSAWGAAQKFSLRYAGKRSKQDFSQEQLEKELDLSDAIPALPDVNLSASSLHLPLAIQQTLESLYLFTSHPLFVEIYQLSEKNIPQYRLVAADAMLAIKAMANILVLIRHGAERMQKRMVRFSEGDLKSLAIQASYLALQLFAQPMSFDSLKASLTPGADDQGETAREILQFFCMFISALPRNGFYHLIPEKFKSHSLRDNVINYLDKLGLGSNFLENATLMLEKLRPAPQTLAIRVTLGPVSSETQPLPPAEQQAVVSEMLSPATSEPEESIAPLQEEILEQPSLESLFAVSDSVAISQQTIEAMSDFAPKTKSELESEFQAEVVTDVGAEIETEMKVESQVEIETQIEAEVKAEIEEEITTFETTLEKVLMHDSSEILSVETDVLPEINEELEVFTSSSEGEELPMITPSFSAANEIQEITMSSPEETTILEEKNIMSVMQDEPVLSVLETAADAGLEQEQYQEEISTESFAVSLAEEPQEVTATLEEPPMFMSEMSFSERSTTFSPTLSQAIATEMNAHEIVMNDVIGLVQDLQQHLLKEKELKMQMEAAHIKVSSAQTTRSYLESKKINSLQQKMCAMWSRLYQESLAESQKIKEAITKFIPNFTEEGVNEVLSSLHTMKVALDSEQFTSDKDLIRRYHDITAKVAAIMQSPAIPDKLKRVKDQVTVLESMKKLDDLAATLLGDGGTFHHDLELYMSHEREVEERVAAGELPSTQVEELESMLKGLKKSLSDWKRGISETYSSLAQISRPLGIASDEVSTLLMNAMGKRLGPQLETQVQKLEMRIAKEIEEFIKLKTNHEAIKTYTEQLEACIENIHIFLEKDLKETSVLFQGVRNSVLATYKGAASHEVKLEAKVRWEEMTEANLQALKETAKQLRTRLLTAKKEVELLALSHDAMEAMKEIIQENEAQLQTGLEQSLAFEEANAARLQHSLNSHNYLADYISQRDSTYV